MPTTTTCIEATTSASGGLPPELVALNSILTQLQAINGNTDLVESLQAASNAALTNLASYVDGLETMVTSLNSNTDGLEAMMASLGINTDEIESYLLDISNAATSIQALVASQVLQGWVLDTSLVPLGVKIPAIIVFYPNEFRTGTGTVDVIFVTQAGATTLLSSLSSTLIFGTNWGLGVVPTGANIAIPKSLEGLDLTILSLPVATVKSLTLVAGANLAVDYSTDAGATYIRIASGSRTWNSSNGGSLNVSAMRFKGSASLAKYEIIYEV